MTQTLQVPWQLAYETQTQGSDSRHSSLDKIKCSSWPGGHLEGGGLTRWERGACLLQGLHKAGQNVAGGCQALEAGWK